MEGFANPIRKRDYHIELFSLFPEAKNMFIRWCKAKENMETLSLESARRFLLEEVIPYCIDQSNKELKRLDYPLIESPESFLPIVGLKSIGVMTAWRWLRLLGFSYDENSKCYYTDGHEREDNVADRMSFIPKYMELEWRTYRWIQMTEDECLKLEDEEKLSKDIEYHTYQNGDGVDMREYHIDDVHSIKSFDNDFGASLSIQKSPGRPIILVGQDEAIICQWIFSSKGWKHEGEGTLKPKSDGDGVMMSAFVTDAHGFKGGIEIPPDLLKKVNDRHRGKEYVSKESAMEINDSTEKPLLKEEDFTNDLVNSPMFMKYTGI